MGAGCAKERTILKTSLVRPVPSCAGSSCAGVGRGARCVVERVRSRLVVVLLGSIGAPFVVLGAPTFALGQVPGPSPSVLGDATPPVVIEGLDARPLVPLEFSRAWLQRTEGVRQRRAELQAEGRLDGASPEELAAEGAALTGVLRVPVIPVRYSDVPEPFPVSVLEERLFGPAVGDTMSYSAYWSEVSGGLLKVEGVVAPWVKLPRPASYYLPPDLYGWASFGRMAEFRTAVLEAADRVLDFGQFDNDGPDGIPNSGDDDGYVDFVAFVYAVRCDGDMRAGSIWPHRGAMAPFETRSPKAGGGRIRISDYVVLPALDPVTCGPMHIGILAHETGHALGLPDLYDYDGSSQGIGAWGLMGTGSHSVKHSPAHPSAWEKEQLGWVTVKWLEAPDDSLVIEPVIGSRTVYRYDIPGGRGRYVLFENRQKEGSDRYLPGAGLLAWHVDPDRGELGIWNRDERRFAVGLIAADGRGDLEAGRSADAGDPFPGVTGRRELEIAGETPLRLSEIEARGDAIVARVAMGYAAPTLVGTPSEVQLTTLPGSGEQTRVVAVARRGGATGGWAARSEAPWLQATRMGEVVVLTADASGLAPGTYRDTVRLVATGGGGGTEVGRVPVELTVAAPGLPEVIATGVTWSWGLAARGGSIYKAGYGWDPLRLRPRPRVLHLTAADEPSETLVRLPAEALYAPVSVPADNSIFVLGRANETNHVYRVGPDGRAEVVAAGLGDVPAYGMTALGDGSVLVADWSGALRRVRRDGAVEPWSQLGEPVYQIAAAPDNTVFAAGYSGDVLRLEMSGLLTRIPTGFGAGRLVAVAAAPDGSAYAAERGGEGRIVHIARNGTIREVSRTPGAAFYGLAVDGAFLYALDLGTRQLLRIPIAESAVRVAEAP